MPNRLKGILSEYVQGLVELIGNDLEKVIHKIHEIIKDHTTLDITEDEFMRIIKDGDD